jgi:3-hydroxyisobutyrate dehydrogenase
MAAGNRLGMSDDLRTVAMLGTGIMGGAMARNIAAAGLEVTAWNRTREKAEALAGERIEVADSPADAARDADAVVTMLTDGDAVREVMEGEDGALEGMAPDSIWVQASTVGLGATAELIEIAERTGTPFVDSPVLGTKAPAEAGELIVLASGTDETIGRVRPLFDAVAARVIELGAAGAGSRMKLVVNHWLLSLTTALAEALALADALELEGARFLAVIEGGPIDTAYAQLKGRMMLSREYEPSFPLSLARKDADLVGEAADVKHLELALNRAVRDRFAAAEQAGHGDEDMAAVRESACITEAD